jgi:catechol 2,3-dioxygenase-like lactoylglutathione lyase family enzyme
MYREGFPILYVSNIERSLRFYRDLLGFTVGYRWIPLDTVGPARDRAPLSS